jgi:predicted Zn finger-like uncharacterized protein
MMRAKCPNCQAAYSIKPEFIGKQTICQNCGQIFTIFEDRPELPQMAPETPQPEPPQQDPPSYAASPPPPAEKPPAEKPPEPAPKPAPPEKTAPPPPKKKADPYQRPLSVSRNTGSRAFNNLLALLLVIVGTAGGFFFYSDKKTKQQLSEVNAQLTRLKNPKIAEIKAERPKIAELLTEESRDLQDYPNGTPMHLLKSAIITELRLTDTLLIQQQAALESGAAMVIKVNNSPTSPEEAKNLETEIQKLTEYINQRTQAGKEMSGETLTALENELGTLHLLKAVLLRNFLTAKYGLNYIYGNQGAKTIPAQASTAASPSAPVTSTPPAAATNDTLPLPLTQPQITPGQTLMPEPPAGPPISDAAAVPEPGQPQLPVPITKVRTVAEILASNPEWKIQGPWATRLSGTGSGLSVRLLRMAAVNHAEINRVPQQASLFVNCQSNKTEMYVTFGLPLGVNANKVEVEYQINEGTIVKETWNSSADQKGIFSPKPIPLLRELVQARKIGFRVPFQNPAQSIETFFELDGLTEAIKPIQSACNWK